MLQREHLVASSVRSLEALSYGISSPTILTFQEWTSAFQGTYGPPACVFVATDAVRWNEIERHRKN